MHDLHVRHLLVKLEPRWIACGGRRGIGVSFVMPGTKRRVSVFFTNPLDGGPPPLAAWTWTRSGASFENLTLTPPADARIVIASGRVRVVRAHGMMPIART